MRYVVICRDETAFYSDFFDVEKWSRDIKCVIDLATESPLMAILGMRLNKTIFDGNY